MEKKIVVFTGAGISAESGLQTFRGKDGLWEGYRIEDVATPEAWNNNPERVQHFYNMRRNSCRKALPNAGHRALVELEKYASSYYNSKYRRPTRARWKHEYLAFTW